MNITKVIKCALVASNHSQFQKLPIIIAGESGIGKTEMLLSYATERGFFPWVLQLNHTTTDQLYGRIPEGSGWRVNPSIDFPTVENVEILAKQYKAKHKKEFPKKILLIIDECNRTKYKALINAVGAMISARVVVNRPLHPSVHIIGTCNLEANQDILPVDKAFATRVLWLMAEPDPAGTAKYLGNDKNVKKLLEDLESTREENSKASWQELMYQIGEDHLGSSRQIEKLQILMPSFYKLHQQGKLSTKDLKELEFGFILSKNRSVELFLKNFRKDFMNGVSSKITEKTDSKTVTPKKEKLQFKSLKEIEGRGSDLEMRKAGIEYIQKIMSGKCTKAQTNEMLKLLKDIVKNTRKSHPRTCSILFGKQEEVTEAFWDKLKPSDRVNGTLFKAIVDAEIKEIKKKKVSL